MTRSAILFALVPSLAVTLGSACSSELPVLTECEAAGDVTPICGFHDPEDLALLPGGAWIVASQMGRDQEGPGDLVAYRVADGRLRALYPPDLDDADAVDAGASRSWGSPDCSQPPDPMRFSPHGVDAARTGTDEKRLAVVNHGGRESIELFEIGYSEGGPLLFWRGCVLAPPGVWANDVVLLPEGGLMVTNMLPGRRGARAVWATARLLFGGETGDVREWRPASGWRTVAGSASSGPNGIAVSRDGREIYVAEWGRDRLVHLSRGERGRTRRESVELPHHPDNLTWTKDGHLLVTGQIGPIGDLMACNQVERGTCAVPFSVVLVEPATLEVTTVLESPTEVMGAGTVALEVGGEIFIGTYAGDRLARAPFPR